MMSLRDSTFRKPSTSSDTFLASSMLVVTKIELASSSCSAWLNRSAATKRGLALSSAITRISLGPAMLSMLTWP